jgi:hypothetical protein
MLTPCPFHRLLKHARYVGLGALLVALPIAGRASIISEEIDFTVGSNNGTVDFTVDTSKALSDAPTGGPYADPDDGLLSLTLNYNSANYTLADFLDAPFLPIVLLPGNNKLTAGLQYEVIGVVVLDGSCPPDISLPGTFNCTGPGPGNTATILGLSPTIEAATVGGAVTIDASVSGSSTIVPVHGQVLTPVFGSITGEESTVPEPALFPVIGLAFAGLLFARRRKVTQ